MFDPPFDCEPSKAFQGMSKRREIIYSIGWVVKLIGAYFDDLHKNGAQKPENRALICSVPGCGTQGGKQQSLPSKSEGRFVRVGTGVRLKLNRFEEALDYFTCATAIDPRSSEIRLSRGRALEKLGRLAEAEKEYQQAVISRNGDSSSFIGCQD